MTKVRVKPTKDSNMVKKIQGKINASIALKNEHLINWGKDLLTSVKTFERSPNAPANKEEELMLSISHYGEEVNEAWMTTVGEPDLNSV